MAIWLRKMYLKLIMYGRWATRLHGQLAYMGNSLTWATRLPNTLCRIMLLFLEAKVVLDQCLKLIRG
jgi:hypothetical protein